LRRQPRHQCPDKDGWYYQSARPSVPIKRKMP
jgi:hypothetical protein